MKDKIINIIDSIKNFRKRLTCKHSYTMIQKFYGDDKNIAYGIEQCKKCGKKRLMR